MKKPSDDSDSRVSNITHHISEAGSYGELVESSATAGRRSAENWKKAFVGWLLVAVAALIVGTADGHNQIVDSDTAFGEAAKTQRIPRALRTVS